MNRFIIKNNQLLVKTLRHNEIVVATDITQQTILDTAQDLIHLALQQRRCNVTGIDFIWCSENERKYIELASKGKTKKQIATLLKIHPHSLNKIICRLREKIEEVSKIEKPPERPKNPRVIYKEVKIKTIPFSILEPTEDADDDDLGLEFGDEGKEVEEMWQGLYQEIPVEQSETFLALKEPRQRELALLLAKGYSRRKCAQLMGISEQAVHQMTARMRKVLRNAKVV